jgi:hypothetical protein
MSKSKISYNIHAQAIKEATRLKNHLLAIQPSVVLFLDGLGAAKEYAALLTDTIVIHRNYGITNGDDDVHLKVTPARWMELRAQEAEGGIWLYTTNEPAFDQKSIQWTVELMELWLKRGIDPAKQYGGLVVGNWAVGNPGPDDWPAAKRMLELLDQHRDLFILGLHEYACGIITSGLYGGYPNNANKPPGEPGGFNLIPHEAWPDDVSKITMWHCGRFNFLVKACAKMGIKPPRIILTEHGMDDVSDIKGWAETLLKTPGYTSIRGWKSLKTWWQFQFPDWSPEQAYFEQLAWADRTIYKDSVVEGQCVFSWGHSSNNWDQFDVSEAGEFQKLMEAYAGSVPPMIEPPPPVIEVPPPTAPSTFPADFAERAITATLQNPGVINVRSTPSISSTVVYQLQPKAYIAKVIREEGLMPGEKYIQSARIDGVTGYWLPIYIESLGVKGWVFSGILNWVITNDGRLRRLQALSNQVDNLTLLLGTVQQGVDELLTEELK